MYRRATRDVLTYQRNRSAFARQDKRQGAASHLADDNHDLALAGSLFDRATVRTIGFAVYRFDLAAEISAVYVTLAAQLGLIGIVNL
jgi:hypothetical protein